MVNVNHNFNSISTYPFSVLWQDDRAKAARDRQVGNITIGNDVWIGTHAVILTDVEVGDGAIVGAGAVVTKSVPPYAIAAGNPARVIKYRFSEGEIRALLKIRWWEWPDEVIEQHMDDFYAPVDQFIRKFS